MFVLFGIDFLGFCEEELFCFIILSDRVLLLDRMLILSFSFEGLLKVGGCSIFGVFWFDRR